LLATNAVYQFQFSLSSEKGKLDATRSRDERRRAILASNNIRILHHFFYYARTGEEEGYEMYNPVVI